MQASRTIAKNTILLTFGVLAGRALGVLVIKKMWPVLGDEGIGIWGAATDLVAIILVMSNFGLGTLLTRDRHFEAVDQIDKIILTDESKSEL